MSEWLFCCGCWEGLTMKVSRMVVISDMAATPVQVVSKVDMGRKERLF